MKNDVIKRMPTKYEIEYMNRQEEELKILGFKVSALFVLAGAGMLLLW